MKIKLIRGLLLVFSCLLISPNVFCQTEKLGILQYTPPKDWKKNESENVVVFSELNQTTGGFCFITLYGLTTGSGDPKADFIGAWENRVVKPFGAEKNPKTETDTTDEWTATAAGSAIEFQGGKAAAFLTVYSRGNQTFSI